MKNFIQIFAAAVLFVICGTAVQGQNQTAVYVNEVSGQANTYLVTMKPFDQGMVTMMNKMAGQENSVFSSVVYNEQAKSFTVVSKRSDVKKPQVENYLTLSLKEATTGQPVKSERAAPTLMPRN